jgi:hypothetical protein
MYIVFDKYLSGYFTEDYWYDDGVMIAEEMLQKFDDGDWELLINSIESKSIEWQTRYAYCIDVGINHEYALKSLMMLTETDNEELFVTVVDSLRCIVKTGDLSTTLSNDALIVRIDKLMSKCGIATKSILEDFKSKV